MWCSAAAGSNLRGELLEDVEVAPLGAAHRTFLLGHEVVVTHEVESSVDRVERKLARRRNLPPARLAGRRVSADDDFTERRVMVEADALAERKRDYVRGRVLSEELTMHPLDLPSVHDGNAERAGRAVILENAP